MDANMDIDTDTAFSRSCDVLRFVILAHVLSDVACDIETSERQRAIALAGIILQPARSIGKRRFRAARPSVCMSCLRDSVQASARAACLPHVVSDISAVPCDVVRAGMSGSKRTLRNFTVLQRILGNHHMQVAVLTINDGELVLHNLGWAFVFGWWLLALFVTACGCWRA